MPPTVAIVSAGELFSSNGFVVASSGHPRGRHFGAGSGRVFVDPAVESVGVDERSAGVDRGRRRRVARCPAIVDGATARTVLVGPYGGTGGGVERGDPAGLRRHEEEVARSGRRHDAGPVDRRTVGDSRQIRGERRFQAADGGRADRRLRRIDSRSAPDRRRIAATRAEAPRAGEATPTASRMAAATPATATVLASAMPASSHRRAVSRSSVLPLAVCPSSGLVAMLAGQRPEVA